MLGQNRVLYAGNTRTPPKWTCKSSVRSTWREKAEVREEEGMRKIKCIWRENVAFLDEVGGKRLRF